MADDYDVQSGFQTLELVGQTDTKDVVTILITTKPSGIAVPIRFDAATFSPAEVAAQAPIFARALEAINAHGNVAAVSHVQDVDAGGTLRDQVIVAVRSDNRALTQDIVAPFDAVLNPALPVVLTDGRAFDSLPAAIDATAAALNQVAGL